MSISLISRGTGGLDVGTLGGMVVTGATNMMMDPFAGAVDPTPYAAYRAAIALASGAISGSQAMRDAITTGADDDGIRRVARALGLDVDLRRVLAALGLSLEDVSRGRDEPDHARPRAYFEAVLRMQSRI